MLLTKRCQFFLYLFWVKTRLEIRLNKVLDTKEPFFVYKRKISESPKNRILPKGLTHAIGEKNTNFFLYLFLVKTRLEIRLNNVLDTKEPFLTIKGKFLKVLKIAFSQRG